MTPSWRQKKKVPSSLASLLNRRSKSAKLSSGTCKKTVVVVSPMPCSQEEGEEAGGGQEEKFWAEQSMSINTLLFPTDIVRRNVNLH